MSTNSNEHARPTVVVSRSSLPGHGVEALRDNFDVRVWDGPDAPSATELCTFISDATGLLAVAKDKINAELFARCPSLRFVAVASTGYDSVDVDAVRAAGAHVTHTPAVLSGAVADHTFFLITGARRRAHEHITMFRTGAWDHHLALDELLGLDVHGQTLGLVGYGQVGKAIARRAVGYDMTVIEHSRGPHDEGAQPVELDELLHRADIVVVCLPLFPETYHIIGSTQLRSMKPTATLVNVGRGATVDEDALVVALREGWIHSAGLDVFETEPIHDPTHPILQLPNAFVTPHMASATLAARASMVSIASADLTAMMQGRSPQHLIAELR
jgi:lactate dehydrogenase-like 2-hydroxyacid dehydrogenase